MHNQRIALIITSVLGIIGTFLPFMKSFFGSVSLIETRDGTGYIMIIAFVISIIVVLLGNHENSLLDGHLTIAIIPGIIPGIIFILLIISRNHHDLSRLVSSFGIGFYLVALASALILILGLALKDNSATVSGINHRV